MTSLTAQPAAKSIPARPVALPPLAAAAPGAPEGYLRPFANPRLNSRLGNRLPAGKWSPSWSAAIDGGMLPAVVLCSGASVLAAGFRACQLLVDGKVVSHIVSAGDDAEIHPSEASFTIADRYSRISSHSLATGAALEALSANGGNDTKRTFLHRQSGRTVVASFDGSSSPHSQVRKQVVYLQVFGGAEETAARDGEMGKLSVAMHNDFIVLARQGAIDFLDLNLNVVRRIEGNLKPLGLSLDESGRAYILSESGGAQHLWIVAPSGEYSIAAAGGSAFHRPPVVGYDHRVYLLALNKIVTIDSAGNHGWSYDAPARVAGATVTADGQLLAGIGDAVVALSPTGEAKTLCKVPGEQMMASPILGAKNELYVLTDRKVHCFNAG